MEPITRSTDGFCHGARGAVTTLSMPTAPAVRRTSQPQIASRFRMTRTPATRHECWAHPRADWPCASGGSGPGCPRRRLVGQAVEAVTATGRRGRTRDGASARRCLASRSRAPVASLATAWRAGPTAGGRSGHGAGASAPVAGARRVDAGGRQPPPRAQGATEWRTGRRRAERRTEPTCWPERYQRAVNPKSQSRKLTTQIR